ncbi:hypothetical protein MUY27_04090 [Mucilaginibacter sp. RS28]|uniref:Uncharacterized protein n=1 Tax=Mucilaginibacter straminoryzae TaxID=2932774 RepID=A0A9X2B8N0_9SPHI|nr:hypothetical protein [Mucilaginibacter straminoryzae]MCJ8208875.1 hypothetical protein [Mucilaginibacter straminoryzae]
MTTRILLLNLLKTLAYSLVLTFIFGMAFFLIRTHGQDTGHAVPVILVGDLSLNLILFIMAIPSLFLTSPDLYRQTTRRLLLYFGGTAVFIVAALTRSNQLSSTIFYELAAVSFLLVQLFHYRALIKRYPVK